MKPLAIPTTKGQVLICLIGTFPKGTINNGRREEASRIIQQSANNRATLSSIRSHWPKLLPTIDPSTRQHLELVRILNNQIKYSKLDAIYLPAVTPAFDEARLGQPKKYVSNWDSSDKIAEALSRSGQHLTGELREMVEQLVSPTNIAIVVGFLLAVAAAHALGAPGAAIDAVLIGIAWVSAGWAGINAVIDFITTTINVLNAKSEADIDKAAKEYAYSFTLLGTAFLARFLGKVKAGKAGSAKAPVKAPAKGASKNSNGKSVKLETQRPKKMQSALDKMPKSFQKEYAAAEAAGWKHPPGHPEAGKTWWPPNNGGVGSPIQTKLPKNFKLDRFGDEKGSYLSKAGDNYDSRALSYIPKHKPNVYAVTERGAQRLTVEKSEISPWFGQIGGGTQYRLVDVTNPTAKLSVRSAIQSGLLKKGP